MSEYRDSQLLRLFFFFNSRICAMASRSQRRAFKEHVALISPVALMAFSSSGANYALLKR